MVSWILTLMQALQPDAPWKSSYEDTAAAIASLVESQDPLFEGSNGREKTAALLVAVAWAESRFNSKAVGDEGKSVGLYQVFHSNLPTPEGFGRTDILGNPTNATAVAYRMLRYSFEMCARVPFTERLGAYTGGTCTGERAVWASKYRMSLAKKVFDAHPPGDATGSGSAVQKASDVPVLAPAPAPEARKPEVKPEPPKEVKMAVLPPPTTAPPARKGQRRPREVRVATIPSEPIDESTLPPIRLSADEVARIEGRPRRSR
jgi:hypothetical protein